MALRLVLGEWNEIVLQTLDGEVVLRRVESQRGDTRLIEIDGPRTVQVTRRRREDQRR